MTKTPELVRFSPNFGTTPSRGHLASKAKVLITVFGLSLVILTSRFEAKRGLFWDRLLNRDQMTRTTPELNCEQSDGNQTSAEIHSQKGSKQTTPLRSPKLVKEVLKRMSSHPSGRDPQVREAFSDEEDPDFYVEEEAMKVIDAFERSLTDLNNEIQTQKTKRQDSQQPPTDGGTSRDQTDNLVEEVLLSERKFEKVPASESVPFSEKYMGREEIEEARRFMSLTTDQKSRRNKAGRESPAPPKPPRNYDSLPRGFKTSTGDSSYDVVSSGIHPLMNGHSTDSGNRVDHQSSSPQQNYFVVVAIDFGTTYSGYAFSFTQDSDNIHMMRKWEGRYFYLKYGGSKVTFATSVHAGAV
ncbi:hypothetical protein AVEN_81016-1 [Araneus ventricosus]|uniref:Heat shock protein 12A n=1 Tax=Araneus ventricosus TaxID=182803 RepID=A0A4Y2RQW6_ARAVE|nr:hypothetical protein AVEN_81016-1 [Araneus ventricosus]